MKLFFLNKELPFLHNSQKRKKFMPSKLRRIFLPSNQPTYLSTLLLPPSGVGSSNWRPNCTPLSQDLNTVTYPPGCSGPWTVSPPAALAPLSWAPTTPRLSLVSPAFSPGSSFSVSFLGNSFPIHSLHSRGFLGSVLSPLPFFNLF